MKANRQRSNKIEIKRQIAQFLANSQSSYPVIESNLKQPDFKPLQSPNPVSVTTIQELKTIVLIVAILMLLLFGLAALDSHYQLVAKLGSRITRTIGL